MIRTTYAHDVVTGECRYCEFAGLSTDTKPEDKVATGSLFVETDTTDVYIYDEGSAEWKKLCTLGGGDA